jgi:hypothetical protein
MVSDTQYYPANPLLTHGLGILLTVLGSPALCQSSPCICTFPPNLSSNTACLAPHPVLIPSCAHLPSPTLSLTLNTRIPHQTCSAYVPGLTHLVLTHLTALILLGDSTPCQASPHAGAFLTPMGILLHGSMAWTISTAFLAVPQIIAQGWVVQKGKEKKKYFKHFYYSHRIIHLLKYTKNRRNKG